uniref:uncharacterized protein LOC122590062 n=1 Tax=Erigeron canadensis TaxID=72917 RepID=UPI001CB99B75|nr:uncharacterized protein LOC122590062 [Erigeron canadensis]XP_043618331.1 uncharacterized protein LOC122590062 [Erigeron canadensis]
MEEEEALTGDEKVAMEILEKEFDWYTVVREYVNKTFGWSEPRIKDDDRTHFLKFMKEMGKTREALCDLMESSAEILLSDLKSLINDERAKFYNYSFEISHKVSDLAFKGYLASFQPSSSSKNSLPFSNSDFKEDKDGKTSSENSSISSNTSTLSSLSENSSISSDTEPPEMITRKRERNRGEETFYLAPPTVEVDIPRRYGEYHCHHHDHRCGKNFRFLEEADDYFDF